MELYDISIKHTHAWYGVDSRGRRRVCGGFSFGNPLVIGFGAFPRGVTKNAASGTRMWPALIFHLNGNHTLFRGHLIEYNNIQGSREKKHGLINMSL